MALWPPVGFDSSADCSAHIAYKGQRIHLSQGGPFDVFGLFLRHSTKTRSTTGPERCFRATSSSRVLAIRKVFMNSRACDAIGSTMVQGTTMGATAGSAAVNSVSMAPVILFLRAGAGFRNSAGWCAGAKQQQPWYRLGTVMDCLPVSQVDRGQGEDDDGTDAEAVRAGATKIMSAFVWTQRFAAKRSR